MKNIKEDIVVIPETGNNKDSDEWSDWRESMIFAGHTGDFSWHSRTSVEDSVHPGESKIFRYHKKRDGKVADEVGPAIMVSNRSDGGFTVAEVKTNPNGDVVVRRISRQPKIVRGTEIKVPSNNIPAEVRRGRFDIKAVKPS